MVGVCSVLSRITYHVSPSSVDESVISSCAARYTSGPRVGKMADRPVFDREERMKACQTMFPRNLNSNINPGYFIPRQGFIAPVWTGGNAPSGGMVTSESAARYTYRVAKVDKSAHLRKDEIKKYVDKAMELRDERKGMPVVSSPIWAPAKSK